MRRIRVKVPATTTNMGPGFDCLGLALSMYNYVDARISDDKTTTVQIKGEGANEHLPPSQNLVLQGIRKIYRELKTPMPGMQLKLTNGIPFTRGLGSSAAAYLSGLAIGNVFNQRPFTQDQLIHWGVEFERHPDNIIPAMLGGFAIAAYTPRGVYWMKCEKVKIPPILVAIPDLQMKTKEARTLLPTQVPFKDAVYNLTRTGLLVGALQEGKWDLLRTAMEDCLHQPYRDTRDKLISSTITTALDAGAYGAALSGSGSSVFMFVPKNSTAIEQKLTLLFKTKKRSVRLLSLKVDQKGMQILDEQ